MCARRRSEPSVSSSDSFLLLDNDKAGRQASETLQAAFGESAVRIALPGVKDVADLATTPNGRSVLLGAMEQWQLPAAA